MKNAESFDGELSPVITLFWLRGPGSFFFAFFSHIAFVFASSPFLPLARFGG